LTINTDEQANRPRVVFKVLTEADWASAMEKGSYAGSADDARDGFIHLSSAEQLAGTAAKHFKGQSKLVLVAFNVAALGSGLRWEVSRGGALFPHFYGALDAGAALSVRPLPLGASGVPALPADLQNGELEA
jgi:uncharacterized protein (DUF952 family)